MSRIGPPDAIRDKMTTEAGLGFLYVDRPTRASLHTSGNVEAQSKTSEFENLRGDLTKVYMDATTERGHITYVFDEKRAVLRRTRKGCVFIWRMGLRRRSSISLSAQRA